MVDATFPAEAEPMLRDVERAGNPWGKPQTERGAWAEELGVRVLEPGDPAPEYLYWVGCAASFDERARASAESERRSCAQGETCGPAKKAMRLWPSSKRCWVAA